MSKHIYIVDTKLCAYYLIQRHRSITDIFNLLAQLLFKLKTRGEVYLCFDIGSSDFRLGEQSYYKGHRKAARAKKTVEEQLAHDMFNEDYVKLVKIFSLINVHILAVDGVEADDLASITAERFKDDKVTLITGDYDWLHMVVATDTTRMYNFPYDEFIYHNDIYARYGVTNRREFSILKSISGDKSDNIKFVRNLGPVKSKTLFDNIMGKYGEPTNDEIIEMIEKVVDNNDNMSLYKHHIDDKRTTLRDAFLSNMKIADPFIVTDDLTDVQIEEYDKCLARVIPTSTKASDFAELSIELFGYPIDLYPKTKKVFTIKD